VYAPLDFAVVGALTKQVRERTSPAADDAPRSVIRLVVTVVATVFVVAAVYISVSLLARRLGLFEPAAWP
jgi:hypothetical protein